MKQRLLAILLTFSMIASMVSPAFATTGSDDGTNTEDDRLIYVSIGDSMTNGYGLDGYDGESGILNYGNNVYANQFAAYLAGYTGDIADDQIIFTADDGSKTVEHRQLAMSGLRPEDVAFLLDLDVTNKTLVNKIAHFTRWPDQATNWNNNGWEIEWTNSGRYTGREYWYSLNGVNGLGQTYGDSKVFGELLDEFYRLADGAARVVAHYDEMTFESDFIEITDTMITTAKNGLSNSEYYPNEGNSSWSTPAKQDTGKLFGTDNWLGVAAEFYQDSVKDADVITLALGNTNFGTWMFDQIKSFLMDQDSKNMFPSRFNIDDVYRQAEATGIDAELLEMIEELIDSEINPILSEQFADVASEALNTTPAGDRQQVSVDPYNKLESKTKGALIKYMVKYCTLSYFVNYIAVVEQIVEANPDADIIQIALLNAYKSEDASNDVEGMSFADLIDKIYEPMNAFLAMLPDYLASKNAAKYENADFYFVNTGSVEVISNVWGNDYYTYDGENISYAEYQKMLAERTVDVNELGHNDSTIRERTHFWLASNEGCYFNRAHANGSENCTHCNGYLTDHFLDIEIVRYPNAGNWGWGDVTYYGEMWKGVLARVECPYPDDNVPPTSEELAEYNKDGHGNLINKFFGKYRLTYISEQDVINYELMSLEEKNELLNGEHSYARDVAFSCAMYLAFEEATIRAGSNEFEVDDLTSLGTTLDTFGGAIELYAEKMGLESVVGAASDITVDAYTITKNLANALVEDGPSATMLCLASRMQIGTGIGGHPSEGGHDTMYAALVRDYEAGNTGDELMEEFLLSYLQTKYPAAMEKLGLVMSSTSDDLSIIFNLLKMSDSTALAGVDLTALEAEIRATLTAYENAHSAEEVAEAQAAADTLYLKLVALATAVTGTEYVAGDDSYYVSLGDSNVNGYGLDGYSADINGGYGQNVEGAAPVELAKELYGDDWESHFGQYAMGSLRSEDLLYLLGGENVVIDDYYTDEVEWRVLANFDSIGDAQSAYVAAIEKADLISITIGGGNVTTFTGEQIDRVVAGETLVEMDWSKIDFKAEDMEQLDKMLDEMVPLVDMLGIMDQYVPAGITIENPAKFARTLLESMLYGYASYNYYYPQVLARIREINPTAQILILGMFNPIDDWIMEVDGDVISIGGIVGNVMEMSNLQNLAYSMQNANTTFVDISDNITFLDAMHADGSIPTFSEYYNSILVGNGLEVHANADGHAYMLDQMLTAISGKGYGAELGDLGQFVYEALQDDYLTTQEKLDILNETYATAKAEGVLGQYPEIAVAEELYLCLVDYIDQEQELDIILFVYSALLDGELTTREVKDIALYIYRTLFAAPVTFRMMRSANAGLSVGDKIAIIEKVYAILDKNGYLAAYPELNAIVEIYNDLSNNGYISDEKALEVFDIVFVGLMENDEVTDEIIAEIGDEVLDAVLNDPTVSDEAKGAIVDKIMEVLEENGLGGVAGLPTMPPAVKEVYDYLSEKEYLDGAQKAAILDYVYDVMTDDGEKDLAVIAEEIYAILNPGLSVADKLDIVYFVYSVAEKYGYLEYEAGVIPTAFGYAWQYAAAEGYLETAGEYLEAALGIVARAYQEIEALDVTDELANTKALLLEELDNAGITISMLMDLISDDVLTAEEWNAILNYQAELDKHIATITELAAEMGVLGDLALTQIEDACEYVETLVNDIAADAYAWAVATDAEFNAEYTKLVNEIVDAVNEINPALGAVVGEYLTETPAEAMKLIFAAGEDAVDEFVSVALALNKGFEAVVDGLAAVLESNIDAIVAAIDANGKIDAIKAEIEAIKAEILGIETANPTHDLTLEQLKAQLAAKQDELVDEIIATIYAVDPYVGASVEAAWNALVDIAGQTGAAGMAYAEWFADRVELLAGDLLTLIIENTKTYGLLAGQIIDEMIWDLIEGIAIEIEEEVDEVLGQIEFSVDLSEVKALIHELETTAAEIRTQISGAKKYTGDVLTGEIETLEDALIAIENYAAELNAFVTNVESLVNGIEMTELTIDSVKELVAQAQVLAADAEELVNGAKASVEVLIAIYEKVMPQIVALAEYVEEGSPVDGVLDTADLKIGSLITVTETGYEETLAQLEASAANIETIVTETLTVVCDTVSVAVEEILVATETAVVDINAAVEEAIAVIKTEAIAFTQSTDAEIIAAGEEILALVEALELTISESAYEAKYYEAEAIVMAIVAAVESVDSAADAEVVFGQAIEALDALHTVAKDVYAIAEGDVLVALDEIDTLALAVADVVAEAAGNIAADAVDAYTVSAEAVCTAAGKTVAAVNTALAAYEESVTEAVEILVPVVTEAIEDIVAEVTVVVEITAQSIDATVEAAEELNAIHDAIEYGIYDATHAEIFVDCDGELNYAYVGKDYTDILAGLTTDEVVATESEDADIITVDFNGTAFAEHMVAQVKGLIADEIKEEVARNDIKAIFAMSGLAEMISTYVNLESDTYVAPVWDDFGADVYTAKEEILTIVENVLKEQGVPVTYTETLVNLLELVKGQVDAETAEVLREAQGLLVGKTVEVPVLDMMLKATESALYDYFCFADEFPVVLNTIRENSPNAHVVVTGLSNNIAEALPAIVTDNVDLSAYNEYIDYVVDALNLHFFLYAAINTNTTYVATDLADAITVVSAEHNYVGEVTAPTCTEMGYTTYTCSVCGHDYVADEVAATGHDYEAVVTEPTCEDGGYTTYTCSVCFDSYVADYTEATGHVAGDAVKENVVSATCTTDGSYDEVVYCSVCGDELSRTTVVVPATGHIDADGDEKCDVCGADLSEDEPYYPPYIPPVPEEKGHCPYCNKDVCHSAEFSDLDLSQWYHTEGYTDYIICRGLMIGMGEGKFGPNVTTTRAMVVTILYRLAGSPAVTGEMPFADVAEGQWYSDAILWAYQNNIVEGYGDGNFGPNDIVTREQMDTMFYRNAKHNGMDVSASADLSGYADADTVSDWALDAVKWAVAVDLMKGRSTTQLAVTAGTTRAETATLFYRWCEEILK